MAPATSERVIRVGVTGHRRFDEPDAVAERVRTGLHRLLALAGEGTASIQVHLEALSPIAEGADRLVAREALATRHATLVAALPFPVDDYASDFGTPASLREFEELLVSASSVEVMPKAASRDVGYEQVGRWVTDHCDLLIALWDGKPSRSRGGTSDIVAYAADRGVPLLWIPVTRT